MKRRPVRLALLCALSLAAMLVMVPAQAASPDAGAASPASGAPEETAVPIDDSLGTEFWLGFMANFGGAQSLQVFVTGPTATNGTVSVPGVGFSQNFSVTPGAVTTIVVPPSTEHQSSNTVLDRGVHVVADDEVAVYLLNRRQATTDASLGLPVDILGDEHIVLGYKNGGAVPGTQFMVVGTENGTTVTITPTMTTNGRTAGVPYDVAMDEGDAYMLQASESGDLSGTIVQSTAPVAVFGGHNCANIPTNRTFCDHIEEQLFPTSTWGESFVTMPLATRLNGDTFRMLAQIDGTTVSVNGASVATLNRGELHEQLIDGPAHITANEPILVAQYSNGTSFDGVTSDPFMMLIPPAEQFLADYTVSTPASGFSGNYLNLTVPNAAVGSVQVDGSAIPAGDYTPIGASGFSGVQIPVGLGSHTATGPSPFGVYSYGFDNADSYGYPGGLALGQVATVTAIALTPASATNQVHTEHCVTATVTDQNNNPVQGVRVDFTVTGVNPTSGFAFTNANGEAQFCYTGTNPGQDEIVANVGAVRSNTATKTWVADTTRPTCRLVSMNATTTVVELRDTGSGLASVAVSQVVNATVVVDPFTPGTNDPVRVAATRDNPNQSGRFNVSFLDRANNRGYCTGMGSLPVGNG